ncbi:MAG: ROK family protein [Vibrio sp.]
MFTAQPGHIDQIRQANTGRVYQLIEQFGPISRIDLSKLSGLAPASITKMTRELMNADLIHEAIVQEVTSRGRPAVGLQTQEKGWQFISMRLGEGKLTIALHEIGGAVVIDSKTKIKPENAEHLLELIVDALRQFIESYHMIIETLTSIALTIPASVNMESGLVYNMPCYEFEQVDVGRRLLEEFQRPIFIGNDISAWALAEKLYGNAQEVNHAILITNQPTVSAGVVLNGQLLQGRLGHIGELGHIQIDPNGKLCQCGHRGCLDTVASTQAICDKVLARVLAGEATVLEAEHISMETICTAATAGDELAMDVIAQLGRDLAKGIAILTNFFQPEKILIGGALNNAKTILYPEMAHELKQHQLPQNANGLPIVQSRFYTQTTMPGAALVKQALYDGELLVKILDEKSNRAESIA